MARINTLELDSNEEKARAAALVHDMAVVTRNVGDFIGTGVRIVDPWQP